VVDESASQDTLEELGLLVQETDRSVARRGVRGLVLLPEEDQLGPPPRSGEHSAPQAVVEHLPEVARDHHARGGPGSAGDAAGTGRPHSRPHPFYGVPELLIGDLSLVPPVLPGDQGGFLPGAHGALVGREEGRENPVSLWGGPSTPCRGAPIA